MSAPIPPPYLGPPPSPPRRSGPLAIVLGLVFVFILVAILLPLLPKKDALVFKGKRLTRAEELEVMQEVEAIHKVALSSRESPEVKRIPVKTEVGKIYKAEIIKFLDLQKEADIKSENFKPEVFLSVQRLSSTAGRNQSKQDSKHWRNFFVYFFEECRGCQKRIENILPAAKNRQTAIMESRFKEAAVATSKYFDSLDSLLIFVDRVGPTLEDGELTFASEEQIKEMDSLEDNMLRAAEAWELAGKRLEEAEL